MSYNTQVMTLEVEMYVGKRKKPVKFPSLNPEQSIHVLSVDSQGRDVIWVVKCRKDDTMSTIHKIYPITIWPSALNPHVAEYDKSESENRAIVIRKGQEQDLYVRQRTETPHSFIHGRYHFKHI